jgi:predicted RNA-binding Zn-ribbon protein involved in translation (DUF1610 family)
VNPTGNCPACGATITFQYAQAMQTTCPYCHSILVRSDVDLRKVGEVAELPPYMSPVQLRTEGQYRGRSFIVTGRIVYEFEQGSWNEWHLAFSDGSTGWLSDAQAQYVVTRARPAPELPPADQISRGKVFEFDKNRYEVTSITQANYVGVEGELPFEYWDKTRVPFVDLRSPGGGFATIDYSEQPPLLFVGEAIEFEDLKLTNLKELQGAAARAKSLECPNCGGPVELRAAEVSLTAVCIQCLSVLDTKSESVNVLQQFRVKQRVKPLIPLGLTGHLRGDDYVNIGFQERSIQVEGQRYAWREYVLFHPAKGFRYLSEYDGHWNFIKPLTHLPEPATARGRRAMKIFGETYAHFQEAHARTDFVMGEFPWRVQVGETVTCNDYVHVPRMLSSETTADEVSWSLGEYTPGADIWRGFKLPGEPPPARGVYANQPSPVSAKVGRVWRNWLWLTLLAVLSMIITSVTMSDKVVFQQAYQFDPNSKNEASFVTPVFELPGRPANVEIETRTNLSNNWMFLGFALINEETGQGWDFGRELSYYSGSDSDGAWTEGSANDSVTLGRIPAGRYYLRIEPDWEPSPGSSTAGPYPLVSYQITVKRDVPQLWFYGFVFVLLLIPPVWVSIRAFSFESQRWAESQYGTISGTVGKDD